MEKAEVIAELRKLLASIKTDVDACIVTSPSWVLRAIEGKLDELENA